MKFKKQKGDKFKAVYDDDLSGYLKSLGIYDGVIEGRILCKYCGNKITLENLTALVPNFNMIEIVCNNEKCIRKI